LPAIRHLSTFLGKEESMSALPRTGTRRPSLALIWPALLAIITVATGLVAVASAGSARASESLPTRSPGMPDPVRSRRYAWLEPAEYRVLAQQWQTYVNDHPRSAAGLAQLARAEFYAGQSQDEVAELLRRALALDPDCPEALETAAYTHLELGSRVAKGPEDAYRMASRATEIAPDWAEPYFTLYPLALRLGRPAEARDHLAAMVRKGGIPAPVLDYCHNMLVSAAPDAIVFTNGDNDTFGALALQVVLGLRPDVAVINLSLINDPDIENVIFARFPAGESPLDRDEREALREEFQRNYTKGHELYSQKVLRALCTRVMKEELTRPLSIAITVSPGTVERCGASLALEGLLWRVDEHERERGGEQGQAGGKDQGQIQEAVQVGRTSHLFAHEFRLDSATDPAYDWRRNVSVAHLMDNYFAVLYRLVRAAGGAGDLDTVRLAAGLAIKIADFHGRDEWVEAMARDWLKLDPGNTEAEQWLRQTGEEGSE
jgi:tetratricopeptide (TPR) repeat protein